MRAIRAAAIVAVLVSGLVPAGAGANEIGAAAPVAEGEAAVAEAVLSPAAEPAPAPARQGAAISATRNVTIGDNFYDPDTLTIDLGDTVTWVNGGTAPEGHTVTGSGFDSGVIEEGGTFSQRFASAGAFDYICELHDDMTGTVVVRAPSSGGDDSDPGGGDGGAGASGDGGGNGSGDGGGSAAGGGDGGDGGGGGTVSESDAVAGDDAAGSNSSLPATGADLLPTALVGLMLLWAGLLLRRRTAA